MNTPIQSDSPTAFSERPLPYPVDDWPYTLFFNATPLPRYAQLWHPISHHVRDPDDEDAVGAREVSEVIWGLESLGTVRSCAPAVFVYAIQELLLFSLRQPEVLREALRENADMAAHRDEVVQALIEGAFRMRESALTQRRAYWSIGYEQWDLPALREIMAAATELPTEYVLPPHHERRQGCLQLHLSRQVSRFHELAQAGIFPKEMRRRLHSITMPDEAFLRLMI